jgi:thiol-disulfide isomerase/thioredoxin
MIIIGAVALAAIIGFVYANRSTPAKTSPATQQSKTTDQPATGSAEATKTPGTYGDYSTAAVKAASGTKILFFHAPWCPQCRELDASIKNGTVPDGVTIFKVDYDTNQELRKKYGVTIQTTLVSIDANGNLVKKFVTYDDPSLSAVTSNLVP